jgi:Icc-related predicted phosphoesterase
VWQRIPADIDILITHGPPFGHGDLCSSGDRAGCEDLLQQVQQRIRPQYHVFGHIHEGYGVTTDGHVTYINASSCNVRYDRNNMNLPIVFDVQPRSRRDA